jgi:hypothetical protein
VIRSGYGIFYNASIYNQLYSQLSQPPFAVSNNLINRPGRVLTLANGFPDDPQFTVLNSYAVDRHLRVGYPTMEPRRTTATATQLDPDPFLHRVQDPPRSAPLA